jgi:hypothetical protein
VIWTEERVTAASVWFFSPTRKLEDPGELDRLVEVLQGVQHALLIGEVQAGKAAARAQEFLDQAYAFVHRTPELDARHREATKLWSVTRLSAALPALAAALEDSDGTERDDALTSLIRFERAAKAGHFTDAQARALAERFLDECAQWRAANPALAERYEQLRKRMTPAAVRTSVMYLHRSYKDATEEEDGPLGEWVRDFVLFERAVQTSGTEPGAATTMANDFLHYAHTWWLKRPSLRVHYNKEKAAGVS